MSPRNFREFPVIDQDHFPGKGWVFDVLIGDFDQPVKPGEILIIEGEFLTVKEVILYCDIDQRNSIIGIVSEEHFEVKEIEIDL
jgi:hypothetical protein